MPPPTNVVRGDRGYDADWCRDAQIKRGITACIPSTTNRRIAIPRDCARYCQRHRAENMFGKIKHWRRIHTRDGRCAHGFVSAISIAQTVIFWLDHRVLTQASAQRRAE